MIWHPFRKEFKMLWKVEKEKNVSYLAGCAHFFPVSYKSSLKSIVKNVDLVIFEGPLDESNMDAIRELSKTNPQGNFIKDSIHREVVELIEKEIKAFYYKDRMDYIPLLKHEKNSLFDMEVEGLSPWMAFFRIWTIFLRNRGWYYSVDLDAHTVAKELKKKIVYLETIEEQIRALEAIPVERIINFISIFHRWDEFAKKHAELYKKGDLERLLLVTVEFPTRYKSIIDERDPVLYTRMRDMMEKGNAIAFVGITHIKGLSYMFEREGFSISKAT